MYFNYNKFKKNIDVPDYLNEKFKNNKTMQSLVIIFVFIVITDIFLFHYASLLLIFTIIYAILIAITLLKPLFDSIHNNKSQNQNNQ